MRAVRASASKNALHQGLFAIIGQNPEAGFLVHTQGIVCLLNGEGDALIPIGFEEFQHLPEQICAYTQVPVFLIQGDCN